jgi:hypothetical protein
MGKMGSRGWLTLWLAVALAISPVKAATNMLPLLGVGGGNTPIVFSFAFVGFIGESSGGTTINYTVTGTNAANANRYLIVVACARMSTVNTLSSMTIDSQSATLVNAGTTTVSQVGGTNGSNCAIYQQTAPNTSCTASCNVSVTWGAATSRTGVSLYRMVTGTPSATSSNNANVTSSASLNTTVTVPATGAAIAGVWESSTTSAISWVNATQDMTTNPAASSLFSTATLSGTGLVSVSVTPNLSTSIMTAAAWGP